MTSIRKDQRGSVSILALVMMICLFAVGAMTTDIAKVFCIKVAVKHKLNLACRSAAAQIDESELAASKMIIDETLAYQSFVNVLKENLVLDDTMRPQRGSILNPGIVWVDYFKVVKPEEVPFRYSFGGYAETMDQPGVTAIISFPVKSGIFSRMAGAPDKTTMYCNVTTSPELISRPIASL